MKSFVLPPSCSGEGELTLDGREFHYLCRVRRLKGGDSVPAMLPDGRRFQLHILERGATSCRALVRAAPETTAEADTHRPTDSSLGHITVYQAVPKGKALDEVLRRCVEAGITRFIPLYSEFTIPSPPENAAESDRRMQRLNRIARSAAEQSGADRVPELGSHLNVHEIPSCGDTHMLGLFLHQEPLAEQSLHRYLDPHPHSIALAIGPEGGFSASELRILEHKGYKPVYLGPRVLRSENAAFFAVAAIRVLLLERESWTTKNNQA